MASIDKYHFYQFNQQGMKAWRYFKPGVQIIQFFVSRKDGLVSSKRNLQRKDHQINNFSAIGIVLSLL